MIIYPIQFSTYRPKDYSKVLGSRKKKKLRSCSSIASKKKKNLNQVSPQEYGAVPISLTRGRILISRFCLIMPSVSPIMVTRLFSSLYCVRKIELLF